MNSTALNQRVLYYGKDQLLPERFKLRAGPLNLLYEDGDLRYIKLGDTEVIRRIYVAIRDRNWGTILPEFLDVRMDIREDSFMIVYDVANRKGEIDFSWRGVITGDENGTLLFSMDGEAHSTFWRNRIGFCVLHPSSAAGARCRVEHTDGTVEQSKLPVVICPDQPVKPFEELRAMAHEVQPGMWAELRFSGDTFEMEDQRNWTDASYKTFCTPLRIPFPVEVKAGTRVEQSIKLTLLPDEPTRAEVVRAQQAEGVPQITFTLDAAATALPLPHIGLGSASHGQLLSELELERLKALRLKHLRVDLVLSDPGFEAALEQAAGEAQAIGAPLEVALFISEDGETELNQLRGAVDRICPSVARWIIHPAKESYKGGSPTSQVVTWARNALASWDLTAEFAAGTNYDLIFLLRNPPPLDSLDQVTFAIVPQAHAFDNASVVETLAAQAQAVQTAKHIAGGLPVIVSPVTFKMRSNPYATGAPPPVPPGELPPQVDERQMSLFGAGWTLGSIRYLAEVGASSCTYFETSGWRGIQETAEGSPVPEKFRSIPGSVFPMYHVFADVAEYAGGELVSSRSSDPLAVDGLVLRKDGRMRLLLANYTAETIHVAVKGLPGEMRLRQMDETTVVPAMTAPEAFRDQEGEIIPATAETVTLPPYAVACLDGSTY